VLESYRRLPGDVPEIDEPEASEPLHEADIMRVRGPMWQAWAGTAAATVGLGFAA